MLSSTRSPAVAAVPVQASPSVSGRLTVIPGGKADLPAGGVDNDIRGPYRPAEEGGVPYFLFVPPQVRPGSRVVVSVHGISRNAEEHAGAFASPAAAAGRIVVAPLFAEDRHRRYQMAAGGTHGADQALLATLDDVAARTGADVSAVDLFGFSGGAQFAHRFAMLRPDRMARLALASAGWYTFPDGRERYPYGLESRGTRVRRMRRQLPEFAGIPMCVLVGERDTDRDAALRQGLPVDAQQGLTRVERAARWARAVREAALRSGVASDVRFRVLPDCGHSFEDCIARSQLADQVMAWFEARP